VVLPSLLLALLVRQYEPAKTWFGPQEVVFNVQYAGNPYDPAVNDVKVRFVNDNGLTVERTAFFDHGAWRTLLVAPLPGRYKATLIHNGRPSMEEPIPSVIVLDQKLPHGFVRRNKLNLNRLSYDDGGALFPFGFNLGWQTPGMAPMEDEIKKMAQAGLTWTRIWADDWDDKNPWWPHDEPFPIKDQLWRKALDRWGKITAACDDAGIDYQFVLFNGGAFSGEKGAEWAKNPWNVANGGFLKSADDFFTDPEAKRRAKMWVRYAVARWCGDPHLFAWELFDDVESTDAARDGRWKEIADWHKEMADTIRSLDPYGRAITTSSDLSHQEVWGSVDFYQPHFHDDSLPSTFATTTLPPDKPGFAGEFGPAHDLGDKERSFVNDVVWQSIRQNRAGAAMYWPWSRVEKLNLMPQFQTWARIISQSSVAQHPLGSAMAVTSTVGQADGLRDINWVMVRLRGADGKAPKLSWSGMIEGTWNATSFNLESGETTNDVAIAKGPKLQLSKVKGQDVVLWLQVSD